MSQFKPIRRFIFMGTWGCKFPKLVTAVLTTAHCKIPDRHGTSRDKITERKAT